MQAWWKLMAAYRRAYDSRHLTYRLTAKNRDQLQNPRLANRLWATFTFFYTEHSSWRVCGPENSFWDKMAFELT